MKISEARLPARAKHALEEYGISTVAELAFLTHKELEDVPNIGRKMIESIKRFLCTYKKGSK